jgi:stress response protein YsnF
MEDCDMPTSVITAFNDEKLADRAIDALRKEGVEGRDIKILNGNADRLVRELADYGFDADEAREFTDAAEQGKTLVAARVADEKADRAVSIMERHEALDVDDGASDEDKGRSAKARGRTVPIVEEELSVETRKVATGGARVTSSVAERPVEQTVTLRDEQVTADRRPADREASQEEAEAAFEEKTVEMMGTTEEVEVRKEARVVGEVEISKQTKERDQTVRDTVRRTDVEVEEIEPKSRKRK